jgi:aryl-alcohol dehydrogenase-like predicted oxidoreductase
MKRVSFSDTAEQLSRICLGTMTFGDQCNEELSRKIVRAALDAGINFFDTAPMYSNGVSEEYLGKAVEGHRKELFLATKVHAGHDEKAIVGSLEQSLKRMKTDYVDLYLIHWPAVGMNLTVMMEALNKTVRSGKAKYVGCCNFPAWLFASCNAIADERKWAKLRCNQIAYNLIERGVEVEILPQAIAEQILITVYRPVCMGLLAGGYREGKGIKPNQRGATESQVVTWLTQHGHSIERFLKHAERKGVRPAQLAAAWVLSSPAVSAAILGASSPEQVTSGAVSPEIVLSDEERMEITDLFNTDVKEEGVQLMPGNTYNFARLRRNLFLAKKG